MSMLIWPLVAAFCIALCLGPVFLPILRKLKFGQTVRDDGPASHLIKSGTPTMGGVVFLVAGLAAAAILGGRLSMWMIVCLATTAGYALIGFLDDYIKIVKHRSLGLRAYQKIIGQVAFSFLLAWYAANDPSVGTKLYVPFLGLMDFGWFYIPFTMFIVVGMTNSVNLTDGLDGLASGVSVMCCATFAFVAFTMAANAQAAGLSGQAENLRDLAVFGSAMAGGCLGFLKMNAHPARVFMGDTGSLGLGGAISALAVLSRMQYLLPIAGGMFIASTISVIIQVISYKTRKKRVFRMAPLHHHFELGGMHETQVVSMYYAITVGLCILGLLSVYTIGGIGA
ncbi:MAG: phospho-N-acetylmuramoyl-pentapeptide-transferase [Clostridia bacterium]|nr:phospho-N-acetylmuramoyl-pentapeptide-transferase [Clostridia bacterium]